MKRKIILRLSYLIVFLTVFWSCHNEDFANGNIEPRRNNAGFFLHSEKGGAAAKSGVDYVAILEAYNRNKNFLSSMPDQQGMPIWDKMKVVDADHATGLIIPLSHDNETMSSILFATLDAENTVTGIKDYDNKLLENIIYNENIDNDLRERLFYTFIYMDNQTFGNEHFTGIPKDLFVGKRLNENPQWMRIGDFKGSGDIKTQTDASGKIIILETNCGMVHQCTHHGGGGTCDNCSSCYFYSCDYIMIYIPDEPFPSGGTGGCTDCGGGGTPGPQPPVDPCVMNTVFYRIKPGCLGSGGDLGIDGLDDPCKKIKKTVNKPPIKDSLASMKNFAQTSKKKERGFQELNNGTTIADQVHNFSVETIISVNTKGLVHVHPLRSIHMFAPMDIMTFLDVLRNKSDATIADSYSGMVSASGTYFISFNGTMADLPAAIVNQQEFDLYVQKLVEDYKKMRDKILKDEGKMPNDTLSSQSAQKLFFETIKNMELDGKINLIQEENGVTSSIILDTNNTPQKQPSC